MQTDRNAGIIVYRESKLPNLFTSFSMPKLDNILQINDETENINVFIFDCPVNGDKLDKKRYKTLRELVDKNKVKFLVERFETQVKSNVSPRKNELHYSELMNEIKAIKLLASVIKLCQDMGDNLLAGSIGFVMNGIDSLNFDLLTDEASSVMVYEGPYITEKHKAELHQSYMEKKGISIIFTKELNTLIEASSVILADGQISLENYEEQLQNKILIGKTNSSKIKGISEVLLWNNELNIKEQSSLPVNYNNEILSIIRYYNSKLDIIEFIKKFPYIYFKFE